MCILHFLRIALNHHPPIPITHFTFRLMPPMIAKPIGTTLIALIAKDVSTTVDGLACASQTCNSSSSAILLRCSGLGIASLASLPCRDALQWQRAQADTDTFWPLPLRFCVAVPLHFQFPQIWLLLCLWLLLHFHRHILLLLHFHLWLIGI